MFRRRISLFLYISAAVVVGGDYTDADSVTGSDSGVTVYRLRSINHGEMFRDDNAAAMAENLEELIMARDHEQEFLTFKEQHNFKKKFDKVPYYVLATSQEDLCVENNGNCSQVCESVGSERVCSCREGYSLTSTTSCSTDSGCDIVLSGTAGEFTIDKSHCQWIIKAPNDHKIEIRLQAMANNNDDYYDYMSEGRIGQIYDGNSTGARFLGSIMSTMEETVLRGSGPTLLIKSWSLGQNRVRVSYNTGLQYLEIEAHSTIGDLEVPVSSLSEDEDCFSLIYSTPQNGSLIVSLRQGYEYLQELTPEFSFKHHEGKWKTDIFRVPYHQGASGIKFEFQGEGTRVYNLGKCLNLEYHAIGVWKSRDRGTVCRNGGTWRYTTQTCACPQGFAGIYCEEGCGPNRYGENCSKLCSSLSSACEGVILCTEELCSCAPGLQGVKCDTTCSSGNYGASCRQRCGRCHDDEPCDRYTGICYSGCAPGFYPPYCQQTYKVLMSGPYIVAVTYNSVKIGIPFEYMAGEGEPIFYEVQYKEEEQNAWSKLSPRIIFNETEFEIMGLLPGKTYEIQVILIDKDGGSYQSDVPKSKAMTKCVDPLQGDYKFEARDVDESSVLLEWSYEHDKTSLICEIVDFELSIISGSEKLNFPIKGTKVIKKLSDMIPDTRYRIQLIGKTVTGNKTLPAEIAVHTLPAAPGRVRAVKTAPFPSGRQLNVTWQSPWNTQGDSIRYRVAYQCVHLLACEETSCDASSGESEVSAASAVLHHLLPHALYQIHVASVSRAGLVSDSYVVTAVTAHAAPHVAPSAREDPILAVTNTSVVLGWKPPEDCSALNGYIYGYSYSLVDNNTEQIIQEGTVPEIILSVNFSDLIPSHCYDAHITVVSSGGAGLSNQLIIPFCTSSTAPDRVQSLSVYKRGRRMVGLRWSQPLNTYGDIEYFTITYNITGINHNRKIVTEPKRCGAWDDLYCFTVSGLSPGKKYHFEVRAHNKEVNIDGEPSAVEAITLEGASTPPVNLRIINATESSMLVEWRMPDNVNGQLRSFIIIVEQIDTQANSFECCDEIPLKDYRVASEEPFYQYEITGLSAASTYSVTVSAKTVTLGEESRIIGHTYPPKPNLPQNALMVVKTEGGSYRPDVVTLQMQPAERISGVNRTYILLYLTNDSSTQQLFHENDLSTLIHSRFTENYHLISEYTQEEVENQSVVTFSLKDMGFVSTECESQKYALLLIQDYMGNQSVDIFISEDAGV